MAEPKEFSIDLLFKYLHKIFDERIVYLDGAMGTTLQKYKLQEEDFRGEKFRAHPSFLRNNSDILNIT